jgi:probable HAF family extracellular repeat protein
MRQVSLVLLLGLLLLGAAPVANAQLNIRGYHIQMLPPSIPGGISRANAINLVGDVVGRSTTSTTWQATLWRRGQPPLDLGNLGGAMGNEANGVDNDSNVVGYSYTAGGTSHAFFWSSAGGIQDLTPSGSNWSCAYACSSLAIVGQFYGLPNTSGYNACKFPSVGTAPLPLGKADNKISIASAANGIEVVGGVTDNSGNSYAAILSPGDQTALPNLPGGTTGMAYGVNTFPSDVVGSADLSGVGPKHAVIWYAGAGGNPTDLGTLGGNISQAQAINNDREVVGWSWKPGDQSHYAFYWRPGQQMQDLRGLLSTSDQQKWAQMYEARGINNKGEIVGYGYYNDHKGTAGDRGFLMTPIRPLPPAIYEGLLSGAGTPD